MVPNRVSDAAVVARVDEPIEPALLAQEEVEVEQVVGGDRRSKPGLEQLGWLVPDLGVNPGRHQESQDAGGSIPDHRLATARTGECVSTEIRVGADSHGEVAGAQFHVAAARARGSDRGHMQSVRQPETPA